jgi:hypothetical protein
MYKVFEVGVSYLCNIIRLCLLIWEAPIRSSYFVLKLSRYFLNIRYLQADLWNMIHILRYKDIELVSSIFFTIYNLLLWYNNSCTWTRKPIRVERVFRFQGNIHQNLYRRELQLQETCTYSKKFYAFRNIIRVIKWRRVKLVRHVALTEEMRNA